jgi:hypothetical protein
MNEMSCDGFADVAAELALGVLTGRERAQALMHLEQCDACRESVRQLTMTGEELVGLLPAIEPPAGFETRVMERIGLAVPGPPPVTGKDRVSLTRRMLAVAAVVLAFAVAGLGGWGLRAGTSSPSSLSSATLLSASHRTVGKIFVNSGSSPWMYMSVTTTSADTTVICQLVGSDGRVTTVGSFKLIDGYGYWGSPVPAGLGPLTGARLVSTDGTTVATASLAGA